MIIPDYPIFTPRLYLRPFEDRDLDDLYAFHSQPDVARFLYWNAQTLEETKQALERKKLEKSLTQEGSRLTLAVALKAVEKVIGEVSLVWRSREHQQGEVGFVFHPNYQGHGYAAEATEVILGLGFEKFNLHRIFGRCDVRNAPSYKLMARLGMRCEAHFVHNEFFKGEWGDEFVYAMLHDEWMAKKKLLST